MKIQQVTGLRARVQVLAVAALVVLSACSTGANRQQHQPGVATPEVFDQPTRGRFSAAQPVVEWWQQLQDARLNDLVAQALEHNHDVLIAVANLREARALYGEAGFDQFPTVTFEAGGTTTVLFGPRITWSAFDTGRVKQRIEAADARVLARVAAFDRTVLQALAETDSAMTRFSREEQRRAHLLEAAVASAKAAAYARERFDSGIDSFLDVLDAERTLLEAQDRLAQSETETVARLIDVYRALGGGWQGRS